MELRRICALYFSATGNTQRVVCALAGTLGRVWRLPVEEIPLITPQERAGERLFRETDFVLLGLPTYAGRLPNKIAPELRGRLRGDGTPAVAVVTYGNRGYDNALAELCALLREGGFYPVGAGAFAGCHAFTDALAPGRPDAADTPGCGILRGGHCGKVGALRSGSAAPLRSRRPRGALLRPAGDGRAAGALFEGEAGNGRGQVPPLRPLRPELPHGCHRPGGGLLRSGDVHQVPALCPRLSGRGEALYGSGVFIPRRHAGADLHPPEGECVVPLKDCARCPL